MKHEKFHYRSLAEVSATAQELDAFLPLQEALAEAGARVLIHTPKQLVEFFRMFR